MAKKRKKKRSGAIAKVLSIILVMGAIGFFGKVLSNLYGMFTLQKQAETVERELQALRDENASLTSTKEKLEDPNYVQTYARGEYMFSKGDEKIFHLPSSD